MKKKNSILYLFSIILFLGLSACSQPKEGYVFPPGPQPEEPNGGGDNDDEEVPPIIGKPKYIWVDAAANSFELADSKENIKRDLQKAKDVGFTDIVVDIRPTNGDVLFKTDKCLQATKFGFWFPGGEYGIVERKATWDYLQAFIEIGHELKLRIHAGFNTFVGGNSLGSFGNFGVLFRDASKKSWATVVNVAGGPVNVMEITNDKHYNTKFLNPANDEVQDYLISLLKDLAAYPDLDGIILDRGRYDNIAADFSKISRSKFEKFYGKKVKNWPEDILQPGAKFPTSPTEMQRKWLEFRAKTIRDFMAKAKKEIRSVNKKVRFGVYVGGWYSSYFDVGVNWASPKYKPVAYWANSTYNTTGYADIMNQILIGAYASPGKVLGNTEWTMQGFCKLAHEKIKGDCKIVAGGPDVGNWDDKNNYTPAQEQKAIKESVQACMNACDGYFLFDMCHLRLGDLWQFVKDGMPK